MSTITQPIARVVEMTEAGMIASLFTGILSIPQSPKIDALVCPQGMDEHWRVLEAVRLWDTGLTEAKNLLIAGDNWRASGPGRPEGGLSCPPVTMNILIQAPYLLKRIHGVEVREFDTNTPTQVQWVMERMEELNLRSLGLCVSSYHCVRWYLTFLKAMIKAEKKYAVIPYSTSSSLDKLVPLSQATPWDSIQGEVKRILEYQEKGDVATLDELKEYLNWLWGHRILFSFVTRAL